MPSSCPMLAFTTLNTYSAPRSTKIATGAWANTWRGRCACVYCRTSTCSVTSKATMEVPTTWPASR